ncbi:MAG: hypothetical protein EZS28_022988 [Streblomastix strix]|uniref:Tetraspanin family protein n=1 Tax=Streblomastix strix TaxID=222440 RepID=A0A5J4VGD1_9EUKA|nr:MAG: hypothetical protein EZS28_022988 [Streblomastix strix]
MAFGKRNEQHPVAALLLRLCDLLYILVGLTILIIGIVYTVYLRNLAALSIVLIVFGVIVISVAFFGIIGAGFESDQGDEGCCSSLFFLTLFFIFALALSLFLLIVGLIAFTAPHLIEGYIYLHVQDYVSTLDEIRKLGEDYTDAIDRAMRYIEIVGGIAIGGAVFIFCGFVVASYLLGFKYFLDVVVSFGSIVLLLAGVLTFTISLYFFLDEPALKDQLNVLIGGIVLGIILFLLGIWGVFSSILFQKFKFLIIITAIAFLLISVGMVIVGIIAFAQSAGVKDRIHDSMVTYCEIDLPNPLGNSKCVDLMNSTMYALCNGSFTEGEIAGCPEAKSDEGYTQRCECSHLSEIKDKNFFFDIVNSYMASFVLGALEVLGILGIIIGIFAAFVTVSAFLLSIRAPTD